MLNSGRLPPGIGEAARFEVASFAVPFARPGLDAVFASAVLDSAVFGPSPGEAARRDELGEAVSRCPEDGRSVAIAWCTITGQTTPIIAIQVKFNIFEVVQDAKSRV